jgi:peptidoglycan/LPS O-acetylase OafA/YrhL
MGLVYIFAGSPFFAAVDRVSDTGGERISNLDGLRGVLAYAVFFHHAAVYHDYLLGHWALPPSRFYVMIGQAGVALFFMISGYLFWEKLIGACGRQRWVSFYVGRIFRLGPLYLLSLAVMLLIIGFRSGFELHVPLVKLFDQIAPWSLLGYFGVGPNINGYPDTGLLVAGVYWSLSYEWTFYFSLIVLAIACRDSRFHLPFVVVLLTSCLGYRIADDVPYWNAIPITCAILFQVGMLCASLKKCGIAPSLNGRAGSIFALVFLTIAVFSSTNAYSVGPVFQLGVFFFSIISGASIYGLLSSRPARRLGEVSYSVYLLQGLVLTLFFGINSIRDFALQSPAQYWASVLVCSLILLVLSAMTHLWVERIGIRIGKRVVAALDSRIVIKSRPVAPIEEG